MNAYEITYIVRPDLDEDQTRAVVDGVTGRLETAGAEIIAVIPWNPPRRRMAYPINDFGDGFYVTCVFRFEPQAINAFENALKLNDRVLRYLLIQATEQNIKQAQQRLAQQQAASAPRPPQPAEETAPAAEATGAAPEPDGEAAAAETEVVPVDSTEEENAPATEPVAVGVEAPAGQPEE